MKCQNCHEPMLEAVYMNGKKVCQKCYFKLKRGRRGPSIYKWLDKFSYVQI